MRDLFLLTQPGYEHVLCEEIQLRMGAPLTPMPETINPGCLLASLPAADFLRSHARPMIFERQRIDNALFIQNSSIKAMARTLIRDVLPPITSCNEPWGVHAYTLASEGGHHLMLRSKSIAGAFIELGRKRFSAVFRRLAPQQDAARSADSPCIPLNTAWILQICTTPTGCWAGAAQACRLSSPFPGGVLRMRFDPQAPSRSYLKIEEVFALMNEHPRPGQTAVDLGAAPGGWTFAFLKRGCNVTAVDNGPLKLPLQSLQPVHLRCDGINFEPRNINLPVDWLAADMLIPPGVAMGLLRRWLGKGLTKRFVVNIKLPQQHPFSALQPIEDLLQKLPQVSFQIRHLYHDRREVTVFGRIKTY